MVAPVLSLRGCRVSPSHLVRSTSWSSPLDGLGGLPLKSRQPPVSVRAPRAASRVR
jgi:hypothetical protein